MKSAALSLMLALVPLSALAQEIEITLADGRMITGVVDDATDDAQLWIRKDEGRVAIAVSYDWNLVSAVQIGGESIDANEFRAGYATYATPWPAHLLFEPNEDRLPHAAYYADPGGLPLVPPRAASATFDAVLANWDGDVEPDGYEIAVTVLDEYGHPVAVNGTLSAKLVGERDNRRGQPVANIELERWSERIDIRQFAHGPALFRLPFRRTRPEVDLDILPGAILQIDVGAFGHGRYASSIAVPLRDFNPVRDRLQQQTGERFFRGERSERPSR